MRTGDMEFLISIFKLNIRMKRIFICWILIILTSCASDSEVALKEKELELKERELALKEKELELASQGVKKEKTGFNFTPNVSISKSASNVRYQGTIIKQMTWKDKNGENLAVFSGNPSNIWVYHYVFNKGETILLREFKDFINDCEFDINLDFIKQSIEITDLDSDNYGELTFAYTLGCRSDVSPLDMKLIMTENGDKYIIRGRQTLVIQSDTYPGQKNIDPSFQRAPLEFLNYAKRQWNLYEKAEF